MRTKVTLSIPLLEKTLHFKADIRGRYKNAIISNCLPWVLVSLSYSLLLDTTGFFHFHNINDLQGTSTVHFHSDTLVFDQSNAAVSLPLAHSDF